MLSRVAERVYWMGRYLERAENSARLVNVNSHLLLDLPKGVTLGWWPLIEITGSQELFHEHHEEATEKSVVKFLVADVKNPGSLSNSIYYARENARTIRDIIPSEAWEKINDLFDYVKHSLPTGLTRKNRFAFLQDVISRTQQITGLLSGTMLHNVGYDFLRLGRNLERAEMTSRIIDVRSESIITAETEDLVPFEQFQWVSVLHSMSAYQAYRQEVQGIIKSDNVLRFLMQNTYFPRSFTRCVNEAKISLLNLPNSKNLVGQADAMLKNINKLNFKTMADEPLDLLIDKLQIELGELNESITGAYFSLERSQKAKQKNKVLTEA